MMTSDKEIVLILCAIAWGWWCIVQHQKKIKKDEKNDWK